VTFGLYSESFYDWNRSQWTVPINAGVSTLLTPWNQHVVLTLAGRYYAERGPYDPVWGAQINFNFLFPQH
jgi:hypothetical protein